MIMTKKMDTVKHILQDTYMEKEIPHLSNITKTL